MEDIFPLLIPIIGVSIPLVVVVGRFIVQPILQTMNRRTELEHTARNAEPMTKRLEATEERLSRLEESLHRVLEEQEFQGKLLSGRSQAPGEGAYSRLDRP